MLEDYEEGLVSNVYTVFEVIDEKELIPEYLMLWFSRPEFDRYARFKSHGSVREVMDWDEMCKVELPVPSYKEQKKVVESYKAITERITLKKQINDNLEATLTATFKKMFVEDDKEQNASFPEGQRHCSRRVLQLCPQPFPYPGQRELHRHESAAGPAYQTAVVGGSGRTAQSCGIA